MNKDLVPNIDQLVEQETAPSLELQEETRKHFEKIAVVQLTTCPTCLNPFAPQREWQVYCSDRCRHRWHSRIRYLGKRKRRSE